jgi:LPXTG-motif cell wall-anchored protein
MADHLRGFDITCTGDTGTPLYLAVGIVVILSGLLFYALQYHLINSSSFNKKGHWWLAAALLCLINFLVAFGLPFGDYQSGNYCSQLIISTTDCVMFGISAAIWSLIWFVILTSFSIPKRFAGHNMRQTAFWKP